jgi:hypothetical protein
MLLSDTARMMFANSEFLLMFNQAATDRASWQSCWDLDSQMDYITNAQPAAALSSGRRYRALCQRVSQGHRLYKLMTTKPGEAD